jgi:RNA polymerase sigma-70 factor (ECF subfamily)
METMTRPSTDGVAAALAADLDGAFETYVRATIDGVFTGALRMLGHRSDAEDVVQDTYARAYRALQGYDRDRILDLSVAGWTWTIAANLCRNRLRSRSRRPTAPLGDHDRADDTPGTEDEALSGLGTALRDAILGLPFPQRAAVVMRHVLDLPYDEIAAALDRPVGTVKSDVSRALTRIRTAHPDLEDLT